MDESAFSSFLVVNRIKKKDIAKYLKVSPQFVSSLCKGDRPLPLDKFDMIKANSEWDLSMFSGEEGGKLKYAEEGDEFQRSIIGAISAVEKIAESNRILAESNHELTITNKILATSNTDLVKRLSKLMDEMRERKTIKYTSMEGKEQIASDVIAPYDK